MGLRARATSRNYPACRVRTRSLAVKVVGVLPRWARREHAAESPVPSLRLAQLSEYFCSGDEHVLHAICGGLPVAQHADAEVGHPSSMAADSEASVRQP